MLKAGRLQAKWAGEIFMARPTGEGIPADAGVKPKWWSSKSGHFKPDDRRGRSTFASHWGLSDIQYHPTIGPALRSLFQTGGSGTLRDHRRPRTGAGARGRGRSRNRRRRQRRSRSPGRAPVQVIIQTDDGSNNGGDGGRSVPVEVVRSPRNVGDATLARMESFGMDFEDYHYTEKDEDAYNQYMYDDALNVLLRAQRVFDSAQKRLQQERILRQRNM